MNREEGTVTLSSANSACGKVAKKKEIETIQLLDQMCRFFFTWTKADVNLRKAAVKE